jgi:hypothetical protein
VFPSRERGEESDQEKAMVNVKERIRTFELTADTILQVFPLVCDGG